MLRMKPSRTSWAASQRAVNPTFEKGKKSSSTATWWGEVGRSQGEKRRFSSLSLPFLNEAEHSDQREDSEFLESGKEQYGDKKGPQKITNISESERERGRSKGSWHLGEDSGVGVQTGLHDVGWESSQDLMKIEQGKEMGSLKAEEICDKYIGLFSISFTPPRCCLLVLGGSPPMLLAGIFSALLCVWKSGAFIAFNTHGAI